MILLATIKQLLTSRFDDLSTRIMAWVAVPGGAAANTAASATNAMETVQNINPVIALAIEWGVVITAVTGLVLILKLATDIWINIKKIKED